MPWYLFGFLSTFFIASYLVASKKILIFKNALEFLTVLASAQFLILIPLIPLVDIPSFEAIIFIIFQGFILTAGLFLQFEVLKKMPISTVAPLNNLLPLFLFSFAFFILGENLTQGKLVGLVITVVGAYFLDFSVKDFLGPIKRMFSSKWEQYLIMAIMLLASVALLDKLILSYKVSTVSLLFFSQLMLALITLITLFITEKWKGVKRAYTIKGGWVLFAAILKNLGNLAYFQAVSLTLVSLVMPLRQLSSFAAAIIGGTIFKEKNILKKSLACLIMVGGVILLII